MNIPAQLTRVAGRGLLLAQKHSPIILTGVGVVGVVTAGVLAARATLKLEDTLDKAKARLDSVEEGNTSGKTKAVTANVLDLVKLYGPSVTLAAGSLVCIISAQGILHKRNAALVVAYKGLEQQYLNYRARVSEEYGEEVDRDFHLGFTTEETVDEKGKKQKTKVLSGKGAAGDYCFIFGPDNPNWVGIHERNEWFLTVNQTTLNDLLRARGHVFLNEVLERLGFEHTAAGAVTGWVNNGDGDSYIDFRMFKLDGEQARLYDQAEPGHILLDFNVDGLIWDQI